jgi:hypothetical protein
LITKRLLETSSSKVEDGMVPLPGQRSMLSGLQVAHFSISPLLLLEFATVEAAVSSASKQRPWHAVFLRKEKKKNGMSIS